MKKQEYIRLYFFDEALERREAESLRKLNLYLQLLL